MKKATFWLLLVLFAVLIFGCNEKTKKIEYTNYKKQGQMQVILINVENRNVEDLKLLGQQLRKEYSSSSMVWIRVFDDAEAANLLGDTSDWPKEQEEFYEKHFIAAYDKNNNSKMNRFLITLPIDEGGEVVMDF